MPNDTERLDWMLTHYARFLRSSWSVRPGETRDPADQDVTIDWKDLRDLKDNDRETTARPDGRAAIDKAMLESFA